MAKIIKRHSKSALVIGLTLALLATYISVPQGKAASLANRQVTLSRSEPSTNSTYDFEADFSDVEVACINVQFCTTASGACSGAGTTLSKTAKGESGDWAGFVYANWTLATAADIVAYTVASGVKPSPLANASFVASLVTNPSSTGTYYARILTTTAATNCATADPDGTDTDTGTVAFAIISGVTVSVTVAETLTSAVYGVASGSCTSTGGTAITSLATSVPFGTVSADTFYDICQDVRIATNANSGYSTRLSSDAALTCSDAGQCGASTIATGSCDGGCSTSAEAAWATAGNNGFGYCMDDTSGDGAATADAGWGTNGCGAGTQNFKLLGTTGTSPIVIMSSAAAVSDDRAYTGYRLTVDASQQAGPYTAAITYTTTPTY